MRTLGLYYRMMRACEIIPSPQSSMKMKKNIRQAFELRRDIPPSLLQESLTEGEDVIKVIKELSANPRFPELFDLYNKEGGKPFD